MPFEPKLPPPGPIADDPGGPPSTWQEIYFALAPVVVDVDFQAFVAAVTVTAIALIRWAQMRKRSIVEGLGVVGLTGAGTYFVSIAARSTGIYVSDPFVLSVGVMLLLAAFMVGRGWLSR